MRLVSALLLLSLAAACGGGGSPTYTLYRTEGVGDSARVHVATFDARDDEASYNRATCEESRELFQVRPDNRARYWCEEGRYAGKR